MLRTEQNLPMRDFAKKSGISKSQLSDIILGNKIPNVYTLHLICTALGIFLSDFFDFDDTVIKFRCKEAILIKIYRELLPMSQDTLIKVVKCMKFYHLGVFGKVSVFTPRSSVHFLVLFKRRLGVSPKSCEK